MKVPTIEVQATSTEASLADEFNFFAKANSLANSLLSLYKRDLSTPWLSIQYLTALFLINCAVLIASSKDLY